MYKRQLTLLSAAFAAAQAAFTALNDNQIRRQAAEGNRRAKSIVKLLKSPRQFMATVTTGQTLCEMFALTSIAPAATAALVSGSYPAGTYVPPTTYFLFLGVVTLCSALVILAPVSYTHLHIVHPWHDRPLQRRGLPFLPLPE